MCRWRSIRWPTDVATDGHRAALSALGLRLQDEDLVDSTNRIVADAARAGADAGLVVRARRQSAGRGRQGRTWVAARGAALLTSFLRRPNVPLAEVSRMTLLCGLAVHDLARSHGVAAWVKWPNDVWVGRRKLAGVLCELAGEALVLGIGVNLQVAELPPEIRGRAAALEGVSSDAALVGLAERIVELERRWVEGDWPRLRVRCEAAMGPMIGASAEVGGRPGRVRGLATDGALLVETEPGHVIRHIAGDVHLGAEFEPCFS